MVPPSPPLPKTAEARRKPTGAETARARRLRRELTGPERRIWGRLRAGRLGVKFRRQEPILSYTVDFVCHERRLIVELDGHQHDAMQAAEAKRTAALQAAGYRVLRFWNSYVVEDIDSVVGTIIHALENPVPDIHAVPVTGVLSGAVSRSAPAGEGFDTPSPHPSPRGGEGAGLGADSPLPSGERPGEGAFPLAPAYEISRADDGRLA